MIEDAAGKFNAYLSRSVPVIDAMRIRMTGMERGRVTATVPLEGNANHVGTVYAGVLFSLAEIVGGALFTTSFDVTRYFPVVKDMRIRFTRPATTDVSVEATLATERISEIAIAADQAGKADFDLQVEVRDAGGTVVATSTATYQIRAR